MTTNLTPWTLIDMRLPIRLLTSLSQQLQETPRTRLFPYRLWQRLATQDWVHLSDLDDLAVEMDGRLLHLDLRSMAEAAGYPTRLIRDGPRFPSAEFVAMPMMAIADVVGFLIFLEQLGFTVNPNPMVDELLGYLVTIQRMTYAQAEIYCYKATKEKYRITLQSEESPDGLPTQQNWRNPTGYRFECMRRGSQVTMLTITGPKWRRQRRMEVDCPQCGTRYTKGDPESALNHRTAHAEVMRILTPKPSKRMRERLSSGVDGERVDVHAPLWMHREVESRARRFKRDFGYDFVQWPSVRTRADLDPRWVGYLFAGVEGTIDGACAFYNDGEGWELHWVWICPDRRRHGLLASRWPRFLAEFGDFWIEHPLSEEMRAFVQRHASARQLELIAARYPNGSSVAHPVARRQVM